MRKLMVFVTLLLALAVWVTPVAAIVYGQEDGNKHPNVGMAIALTSPTEGTLCSGILVHPRVFLTAGHCTAAWEEPFEAGDLELNVSFAKSGAFDPSTWRAVKKIITHPEFDGRSQSDTHDVGVLILNKPVKGIKPASLPSEGLLDTLGKLKGTKFTVVGYGAGLEFPPPQFIDPDGKRRVAASEFQTLLKTLLVLSQKATDGGGTCHGDSGGPVFWSNGGTETLVGITSLGDPNCVATGRYYRADIPQTLNFINNVLAGLK